MIKIQYHPRSQRGSVLVPLMDYRAQVMSRSANQRPLSGGLPIAPFNTMGDFMFARSAIQNNLTNSAIDAFLDVHHLSAESPVTFKNHRDVRKILDQASTLLTQVCTNNLKDCEPTDYSNLV